jgi:hypothetical protein
MEAIVKNQAQLIAELIHYGYTLESISREEFWNTYEDNKDAEHRDDMSQYEYKEFRCECWSFSIDGYDYYSYGYLISSGYDGYDSVGYICRKKVSTNAEINAFVEMMSR